MNIIQSVGLIVAFLLIMSTTESRADEVAISVGDDVRLCGRLIIEVSNGAPTFGEQPEKDEKISGKILKLNSAIKISEFVNQGIGIVAEEVNKFEIFVGEPNETSVKLDKFVNQNVVITGTVFPSDTGFQITNYIINEKSIEICKEQTKCFCANN
jgi:hypothetical protein